MKSSESLNKIAQRLFRENICATPLDERSLETVEQYILYYKSGNDLCRRLSDIELNYIQISSEAQSACNSVSQARDNIIAILRELTDKWRDSAHLQNYIFTLSNEDSIQIRYLYTEALETIRKHITNITENLMVISETAAQIRACAASFTEVYKESRLAIYAATLNRDIDGVLDCRSTSLQAHASARECEKTSANLLGAARICTRIIACVNNMIIEAAHALNLDEFESAIIGNLSPSAANTVIINCIIALENLIFDN